MSRTGAMSKLNKYLHYINVFIKSPEKRTLTRDLLKEIRQKGLATGVQSYLHLKASYFFPGYDLNADYDPILSVGKQHNLSVTLPLAVAPKVSVIIPMCNEVEHVYYCIRSILEKSNFNNYEVIVVDDASEKGTSFLNEHIKNLTIIKNDIQQGYIRSCNVAAGNAKGEYLLFLSHDTLVRKDWMAEMLKTFERFEGIGIVGSMHVNPDNKVKEAGGIVWSDGSKTQYGHGDEPEEAEYNFLREVDCVSGSSMMVRREVWEEAGGYDERYLLQSCEDVDICLTTWKLGYKVVYQPASVVVHYEGARYDKDVDMSTKKQLAQCRKLFREKWQEELAQKSKKGKKIFLERSRGARYKHVLVIGQDVPATENNNTENISNLMDMLMDMGCKVAFMSTYDRQSQQHIDTLQQKGVEVMVGDYQDYLKENMHYFEAVVLTKVAAAIPQVVLLRNNNYKGVIINYCKTLTHLRVDQEVVTGRDLSFDLQAKLLKAHEDFVYSHADHSLLVSWDEIKYLQTYISKPMHYVPPYHFEIKKQINDFDQREGIVFAGEGSTIQDQDAIRWLLDKVYGQLHTKGIKLTIACANTPSFVFDYKKQYNLLSIVSDTSVDGLDKLYATARVMVAPVRIGYGMKGRLIHAMASALPVAGTYLAFEGIPEDKDYKYTVHNTADELAGEILSLHAERDRWQQMSGAGIAYVTKHFNTASLRNTLSSILNISSN